MTEEIGHSAGAGSSDHGSAHPKESPHNKDTTMKYEDVLALAKAGFTSQQIAQFAEEERMAPPAPEAPKVQEVPAAPEVPKAEVPPQAPPAAPEPPKVNPTDEILQGISQELAALKKSIQTHNLQSTSQPIRESTESILASIISPTYTHKEV